MLHGTQKDNNERVHEVGVGNIPFRVHVSCVRYVASYMIDCGGWLGARADYDGHTSA